MLSAFLLVLSAFAAPPELPAAAQAALAEGMAAQREGRTDAALAAYATCLAVAPDAPACLWEQGWSHWSRGSWEAVVTAWERLHAVAPEHPELDRWLPEARQQAAASAARKARVAETPPVARPHRPDGAVLRLRAVGDLMLGTDSPPGHLPPDDGAGLLAAVTPWLRDADLTFGNLEGPLCDGGRTRKCDGVAPERCYAFRTPTRYGAHLAEAGFDLLSTANNHAGDFGSTCRDQTHATLDALGIAWSGPPGTVATVALGEARVGMVAFHTSGSGNWLLDHDGAAALVAATAADHDWVVVSFHGGAEGKKALHVPDGMETFYGEKRGHLRAFARAVVAAGADVVLGHGPHVPRGLELVDGHLVAYSLGNFATYGRFNLSGANGLSLVLEVELDAEGRFVGGRILPVTQEGRGVPRPDPEAEVVGLIAELSEADFGEAAPRIGPDGTLAPR